MQIDENKRPRANLKTYFAKNAIPTDTQFAQLIDSGLNQRDDGMVKAPGDALSLEAAGDDAGFKKAVNFYLSFADADPAWSIALKPRANPGAPNTGRLGWAILDAGGTARLAIDAANGNVGVGTVTPADKLDVAGRVRAGTLTIGPWPANAQYAFIGSNALDQAQPGNYALLQSNSGGDAGTTFVNSPTSVRIRLDNADKLTVSDRGVDVALPLRANALTVDGAIRAGGSDIYFTETEHNHTGTGNAAGNAAIENAKDYEALMLLGRAVPGKGRRIRAWDHLEVNGTFDVQGVITVNDKRAIEGGDTWLRLNQQKQFTSGVHTPHVLSSMSLNIGGVNGWADPGGGNLWLSGQQNKLDVGVAFNAIVRCADFHLGGHPGRRGQPGRALVDSTDTLVLNFNGDWAKTLIGGQTTIQRLVSPSSARLKTDIEPVSAARAAAIVGGLDAVSFRYREGDPNPRLGFIAEDSPAEVATAERDGLLVSDIVAALVRFVRDQAERIAALEARLETAGTR